LSLHPQTGSALPVASPSPYRFGKYTLLAKLAQGGMGEVFAALLSGEAGFEKLVVIKRILPHLAEDPRFISMFLTEARVTASLTHPNICQVFELGQIDGEYYLAMEYLEGVSLARLIRQNLNRGLDLRIAAGILCQTLEGLQFAHCFRQPGRGMVGIVHRDMSPSNVFVTSAGLVKVLDFGVAKVSHHAITTATGLKGKYPYMAPEQIRGMELDGRADLFAVGVLLYEVVTGRSLFHRSSDFETLMAVVNGDHPPASAVRPDIPLGLEEVIDRSLRVAREERYTSAREMSEALARALEPAASAATSRELAELVRRDCADDLEDERDRIHHATSYLKSLADRGQEPPAFINRRARPVMALPAGAEPSQAPSASHGTSEPSIDEIAEDATRPTEFDRILVRSSRRNLVAVLLVAAALLAGAAGWWLRGSPDHPRVASAPTRSSENASTAGPTASVRKTDGTDPAEAAKVTDGTVSATAPGPTGSSPSGDPNARKVEADPTTTERPGSDSEPAPPEVARERGGTDDSARRNRTRRSGSRRSERAAAQAEVGYFSVDASPYASIYVDDVLVGITPLLRVPLRPGKHSVRAVAEDGSVQRFPITIVAGETETRRVRLDVLRP
jgi:serine/threonine protein kinase